MIFKFRLLSDEIENFMRDYEVPYNMTLLEFHRFISSDLGYSPDELASFFKSDVDWEKFQEFTLLDMGTDGVDIDPDNDELAAPVPMSEVTLGLIMTNRFDRLIYVFDLLMERALYIELIESKFSEEGAVYPRKVLSEGNPPQQLLDQEEDIFAQAMSDFEDFEGYEEFDDE